MTSNEMDSVIRRTYALGLEDGYRGGWRDGFAAGKRRARSKPFMAKRAGAPRKGTLTNKQFLDLLVQARSALAAE
jgi:hypothetical protein